mmetsp:Transcript_18287/g.70653  ORF Transcript_18287/g.70653 Transcript_18287/m.70653 type:complete len:297 (-) Transcript_18287:3799-4689(-)
MREEGLPLAAVGGEVGTHRGKALERSLQLCDVSHLALAEEVGQRGKGVQVGGGGHVLAALHEEVCLCLGQLVGAALEADLRQAEGERALVLVEERTRDAEEDGLEEVRREDLQARRRLLHTLEAVVVVEDAVEHVQEERERELVEEVHRRQLLHREEDAAAEGGHRRVHCAHRSDLLEDQLRLFHLCHDLQRLILERRQGVHHLVVVQDVAARLVESREQRLLEAAETDAELALQLEEVGTLLLDVGPLGLEDLVEALALQRAGRHREVDEGHAGTEVGREVRRRVPCREEDDERG